jgi:hypothetical protein
VFVFRSGHRRPVRGRVSSGLRNDRVGRLHRRVRLTTPRLVVQRDFGFIQVPFRLYIVLRKLILKQCDDNMNQMITLTVITNKRSLLYCNLILASHFLSGVFKKQIFWTIIFDWRFYSLIYLKVGRYSK